MSERMSKRNRRKLQELWHRYDRDHSGTISVKELAIIMRVIGMSPTREELEEMMAEADKNGSGVLERREFWEFMRSKVEEWEKKDPVEELINAFKEFDEEGTGLVNKDMLASILSQEGDPLSDEELDDMMRNADADGDGNITYREFVRYHFFSHKRRKRGDQKARRRKKREEPRTLDWDDARRDAWTFPPTVYNGSYSYHGTTKPTLDEVEGAISVGIASVEAAPSDYLGVYFQSSMVDWPEDQQKYTLVHRTGSGFSVKPDDEGAFTFIKASYEALDPSATVEPDEYTETVLAQFRGETLGQLKSPGRCQGVADVPGIKIYNEIEPSDIAQGGVGDCWLLSAISALAEYDGAIERLFRETPNVANMPASAPANLTVTLWDLESWEERQVVIDERLCTKPDGSHLLGCAPSVTGELWSCYLEKAIAIHCGGWDKIDGGQATHAWRILTGSKEQYSFRANEDGWRCLGSLNPNTGEHEKLANSPKDGSKRLWPMPWPEVGGGGDLHLQIDQDDMFGRMCEWEDTNYIMCASTGGASDSEDHEGIVDNHCYTILNVVSNPAGKEVYLVKLRNPWHKGEFKSGEWDDDGEGWTKYPEVKEELKPVQANDGVFWLDREEFFEYFTGVNLCAVDMSAFAG